MKSLEKGDFIFLQIRFYPSSSLIRTKNMKVILILALVTCCSLIVFADVPVDGKLHPPIGRGIKSDEEQQVEEKGTCAGVMLLTTGIFLLGFWLIRKNSLQMATPQKLEENLSI